MGKRGETERGSRPTYRAREGRLSGSLIPAIASEIAGMSSTRSHARFGGEVEDGDVTDDVTWDPPGSDRAGKKKAGSCWAAGSRARCGK